MTVFNCPLNILLCLVVGVNGRKCELEHLVIPRVMTAVKQFVET